MAEKSLSACLAEIKANQGRFYVYILSRPDGSPFYVGCGRGSRISQHVPESRRKKTHPKSRIIREIIRNGGSVRYQIESWHSEFSAALSREVEVIASIGRRDLGAGPLVNLTEGGDGVTSPAKEVRLKQSKAMSQRWRDPAQRERLSQSMKKAFAVSAIRRERASEQGIVMRAALAARREDPAWQKELDKRRLHAQSTAEGKAKRSAISKAMWADPHRRAHILERYREFLQRRPSKS